MSQPAILKPGQTATLQPSNPSKPLPRRVPSHQSVSIKRSPALKSSDNPPHGKAASGTSSLANNRDSSGGSSSNAEAWFERTNNNGPRHRAAPVDGESPFYFQQSSSDSQEQLRDSHHNGRPFPFRPQLVHKMSSGGESSEEYRSVIDDLTVQNQKLKRKLRRFEKMNDNKIGSDKLFEVRVHGLSSTKKRELQETLEKFAMGLTDPQPTTSNDSTPPTLEGTKGTTKPSSRVADSGYGSLATSGQDSSRQGSSGQGSTAPSGERSRVSGAEASKARDQSIRSYLHDIPEGLLPQKSSAMTETARKKLVVRRLEQVFGGKGATLDGNHQPQQQQELSQTAAKDDQTAREAQGRKPLVEGRREAHIMNKETEDPMDFTRTSQNNRQQATSPSNNILSSEEKIDETDFAITSPNPEEQRPTRPLDLDLHRAQVPTENIEYFRHLGFAVPDIQSNRFNLKDGGWLYLNLVINMAQLHTINVTPEFVKHAIKDYSQKFELSSDGRKIRWKGGQEITRSASNAGISDASTQATPYESSETPKKRNRPPTFETGSSSEWSENPSKKVALSDEAEDPFSYTPMFPHQRNSDSDSMMGDSTTSLVSPYPADNGNSSTWASSAKPSSSYSHRKDDGPIIFYNNAKFCIDLSGDKRREKKTNVKFDYSPIATTPMGVDRNEQYPRSEPQFIKDRPLNNASLPDTASISAGSTDPMDDLQFPTMLSPRHVTFEEPQDPIPLEASGIGGVRPDDNLIIGVIRKHSTTTSPPAPQSATTASAVRPYGSIKKPSPLVKETIVSTRRTSLPPSKVPPPIYTYDEDGSDSGDEDVSEIDMDDLANAEPLRQARISTAIDRDSNDSDSDSASISSTSPEVISQCSDVASNGEEDGSPGYADDEVDFLAQARKIDPQTIRAREREYDAEMAERLADEIPAGSSAATAGGGSGFASPADGVKTPEAGVSSEAVKRRMKKQQRDGEIDDSSEEEDEEMDDGVERSIAS